MSHPGEMMVKKCNRKMPPKRNPVTLLSPPSLSAFLPSRHAMWPPRCHSMYIISYSLVCRGIWKVPIQRPAQSFLRSLMRRGLHTLSCSLTYGTIPQGFPTICLHCVNLSELVFQPSNVSHEMCFFSVVWI